jgi:hypothetical protein
MRALGKRSGAVGVSRAGDGERSFSDLSRGGVAWLGGSAPRFAPPGIFGAEGEGRGALPT